MFSSSNPTPPSLLLGLPPFFPPQLGSRSSLPPRKSLFSRFIALSPLIAHLRPRSVPLRNASPLFSQLVKNFPLPSFTRLLSLVDIFSCTSYNPSRLSLPHKGGSDHLSSFFNSHVCQSSGNGVPRPLFRRLFRRTPWPPTRHLLPPTVVYVPLPSGQRPQLKREECFATPHGEFRFAFILNSAVFSSVFS